MNKEIVYVPISVEKELPNESGRYGVIIEGSDCIDTSVFIKENFHWSQIGSKKVSAWLKPIPLSEMVAPLVDALEEIIKRHDANTVTVSIAKEALKQYK